MQIGFYFDQTRCIGCYTCVVACKDWHDIPAGQGGWRRVISIEKGKYPEVFIAHLSTSCHHCSCPACVTACPVEAIEKREEDGIVIVHPEACLGEDSCGACLESCPYNAPQFGLGPESKMQKCNLCMDRLTENKKSVCVDACPLRALDVGPIEELKKIYGHINEAEGFVYSDELIPSIIFKCKQDPKDLAVQKITVTPDVTATINE